MPVSAYIQEVRGLIGSRMLMLPSASAVVLNDTGAILLGRRSDNGKWSLISGVVDPGEQPADAILREILEETGVVATVERVAGVALRPVTYPHGDECQYLSVWFRCRAVGGRARVADDESTEVGWFAPDSLPPMDDWVHLCIGAALSDQDAAWFAQPGQAYPALGFTPPA